MAEGEATKEESSQQGFVMSTRYEDLDSKKQFPPPNASSSMYEGTNAYM